MTDTRIIPFSFEDRSIRTIHLNQQPYFVAKDVCDVLGISNGRDAVREKLDPDEKLMSDIPTPGQRRKVWLVNESGLYHLIFRSNKPEAQAFRKWVTSEVLPALRKTGSYQVPAADRPGAQLTLPFLDADHYIDQIKREMLEVALRVSPGSRAGRFLKLIKPLVYGAKTERP